MITLGAPTPAVVTDPRTVEAEEDKVLNYVLERMAVSERFDRPFKESCLGYWKQINNILPDNWAYFNKFFEPATQIACKDTVDGIMGQVFAKNQYFDLEPTEDQDAAQVEMMRELMRYVLREKVDYEMIKFFQCQEATFYGNGVEKHLTQPKLIHRAGRYPVKTRDLFPTTLGMKRVVSHKLEVWPTSKIVSRFDCYPAPTGATIQEMPYFIERVIVPIEKLKMLGKMGGYKNTEKIEGFFSLDQTEGQATGNFSELHFDLYERLASVGYDVRSGGSDGAAGTDAVKYAEVLIYSESPHADEGCSRVVMVADRRFVIKDSANPFDHGLKPYSEIKFTPRAAQVWQAKGVPELVETLQYKLNARINQVGDIIDLIRSPMTYVGAGAGVQDLSDLDEWPGAQVRVSDPRQIVERTRPGVPAEILREIDYTQASFQRASGSSDYSKGIAGKTTGLDRGAETARGIGLLMQAANQAKSFAWLMAEKTGVRMGLNITAQNIQQVLTVPQKIRILGENEVLKRAGWKDYLVVRPEDIYGRFDFYAVGASQAVDAATQAALISEGIKGAMQLPDVFARLKQVDAWLEGMEAAGVRNPRHLIMSDEELQAKQAEQGPPTPPELSALLSDVRYQDFPPDVQRQVEARLGLEPSQIGGSSPTDKLMAQTAVKRQQITTKQPKGVAA